MKDYSDLLFEPLKKHAKLVVAGIDNRTALELAFGKEEADKSYKVISEIKNREYTPNHKNN